MDSRLIIFAVKGGIKNVGHSPNPNFHLLCYDFKSNIGYIEDIDENTWKLYTLNLNLLKRYQSETEYKFYYYGKSFSECVDKLHEITGKTIAVITIHDIVKSKL